MRRLTGVVHLENARPVFPVREKALTELTLHELVMRLLQEGWVWGVLPQSRAERSRLFHVPGEEKKFYIDNRTLMHKLYIIALLRADHLHVEVPHFSLRPAQVYAALLGEDAEHVPVRNMRLRLQPDISEERAGQADEPNMEDVDEVLSPPS